jgi:hypothetical protein
MEVGTWASVVGGKYDGETGTIVSVAAQSCKLSIEGVLTGYIKKTALTIIQKKVKRKKNPLAPRRPLTAYLIFCMEERKVVNTDQPELRGRVVMNELGKRWQALSMEKKVPFTEKAKILLQEYTAKLTLFNSQFVAHQAAQATEAEEKEAAAGAAGSGGGRRPRKTLPRMDPEETLRAFAESVGMPVDAMWDGVTRGDEGEIVEIVREFKDLKGTLPVGDMHMPYLRELDLSCNWELKGEARGL